MKKIYSIFLLIIFICSFSFVSANTKKSNLELLGKVIYIDPGHGGMDPGCNIGDIKESDIVLDISFKIKEVLELETKPSNINPANA